MNRQPYIPEILPLNFSDAEKLNMYKEVEKLQELLIILKFKLNSALINENLLQLFSLIESVESTRIEGTQATFSSMLEFASTSKTKITHSDDATEVNNYQEALRYGVEQVLNGNPISVRLIKKLHEIILENSRGANRSPGEFRKIQNWIGEEGKTIQQASHIPPEPQEIDSYIANLERYINTDMDDLPKIVRVAIIHAQFETIHPFLDGNGRLGRILIILCLLNYGVIDSPIFFMSQELEKNKYLYYSLLNNTRNSPAEWNEWITFFITSAKKQTQSYLVKIEEVEKLYTEWKSLHDSHVSEKILAAIFKKPIFTIKEIVEITNLSSTTVRKWIDFYLEKRIIHGDGKQRNQIFYCYQLLNILEQ